MLDKEKKVVKDAKTKRAERVHHKKVKDQNLNAISNVDGDYIVCKPPKNWKHVYLRSEKFRRAKQLGIEYPRKSTRQMLDAMDNE